MLILNTHVWDGKNIRCPRLETLRTPTYVCIQLNWLFGKENMSRNSNFTGETKN
jgi:hypothetical protein